MHLLVTGAAGMLGQDVVKAARAAGHTVTELGKGDLDVTDDAATRAALAEHRPDAVVNCAAWTDVDGAEADEEAALAINGTGAGNVARAAAEVGAAIVHVSTDYVFDGRADRPYVESDPTNPLGAYGRTKLAGEEAVAAANPRHHIARTAWLFGAGGPNFVATMLRLGRERGEVSVVTDQVGCPTWTGHLAPALVELAAREEYGIWHLAGAGRCSWNQLTREAFRRAGLEEVPVHKVTSDAFPRPAARPAWSVLASERANPIVLPPWEEGVGGYLAEIGVPA